MSIANEYERYMLELVNAERAAVGAAALQLELNLNLSAELHTQWMSSADIFSHTGENGSTARQRMSDAGFDFGTSSTAAENIAAQSERDEDGIMDDVYDLHVSLMNSPGHRAHILNPTLEYIGIGIDTGPLTYTRDDGSTVSLYSVLVTQNFARTPDGIPDLDLGEIRGTLASETLDGTSAGDTIFGLRGNDILNGLAGNDTLNGNDGGDRLNGDAGEDTLFGGRGNDILNGGSDNDTLNGGFGRDKIYGAAGDDTLIGGRDDDSLYGGNGSDIVKGGTGLDRLEGGKGNDILTGGADADIFVFLRGGDTDRITDFRNNVDEIDLVGFNLGSVSAALDFATQVGADTVFDFGRDDILIIEDTVKSVLADDLLI